MDEFARFAVNSCWLNDGTSELEAWCNDCKLDLLMHSTESVDVPGLLKILREHNASTHA